MDFGYDYKIKQNRAVIRRRRAEVKRQKLLLAGILIAAVLILTFSTGARLTFAKISNNSVKRVKYYKAVMIKCGDSLNKIAEEMYTDDFKDISTYKHEINMINHLDEDEELIAGNYLTIPYYTNFTAE